MKLSMIELEEIAKYAVLDIGEVDERGLCLGRCNEISKEIIRRLVEQDFTYPDDVDIITPLLLEAGGYASGLHKAVILPKQRLIIDTQLWQIGKKRTNLNSRKVIFSFKEYEDRGLKL